MKYLCELPVVDLTIYENGPIRMAPFSGHLDVVKYLYMLCIYRTRCRLTHHILSNYSVIRCNLVSEIRRLPSMGTFHIGEMYREVKASFMRMV